MLVIMVQHRTSDQYLISGQVWIASIQRFRKYSILKTLTNAEAMVTAIALSVLLYR